MTNHLASGTMCRHRFGFVGLDSQGVRPRGMVMTRSGGGLRKDILAVPVKVSVFK